ncbi:MAG: hypothetical protein WCT04_14215 [Planctomycetota bacterium]
MPNARQFFRLHLSTAVLLMFVAGGLMWVNTADRKWLDPKLAAEIHAIKNDDGEYFSPDFAEDPYGGVEYFMQAVRGWPSFAHSRPLKVRRMFAAPYVNEKGDFIYSGVAIDILIALTILIVVWQLCEWRIRRQAVTQQSE